MKTSELIGMLIASIAANGDLDLCAGNSWDLEDHSYDILHADFIEVVDGQNGIKLAVLVKE
jgi:hypothetical protein